MKIEFYSHEIGLDNIEIKFEIDFYPGRPAPACSNPDSPLFSDPGDGAEINDCEMYLTCGNMSYKMSESAQWLADDIFYRNEEKIFELCQKKYLEESEYARFD